MGKLSAAEKEKTKIRERHRRAITTRIFTGLRKHGGYNLPPRADINDVLRALATEAGWIVETDGTTYRPQTAQQPTMSQISLPQSAGSGRTTSLTTRSSNSLIAAGFNCGLPGLMIEQQQLDPRAGDCSTTASPRHMAAAAASMPLLQQQHNNSGLSTSPFASPASSEGGAPNARPRNSSTTSYGGGYQHHHTHLPYGLSLDRDSADDTTAGGYFSADTLDMPRHDLVARNQLSSLIYSMQQQQQQQQQHGAAAAAAAAARLGSRGASLMMLGAHQNATFLQEQRASNHNTPLGSPQRHC